MSAGLCAVASVPYLIFADVKLQKWAKIPNSNVNIASIELNENRPNLKDLKKTSDGFEPEAAVSLLRK